MIKGARKKNMKLIENVIAAFEKGDILQNVDSITERRYSLEMRYYLECYFDLVANLIDLFLGPLKLIMRVLNKTF